MVPRDGIEPPTPRALRASILAYVSASGENGAPARKNFEPLGKTIE